LYGFFRLSLGGENHPNSGICKAEADERILGRFSGKKDQDFQDGRISRIKGT
jgi:hypothetical protein